MNAILRTDTITNRKWLELAERADPALCKALSTAGWRWSRFRAQVATQQCPHCAQPFSPDQ